MELPIIAVINCQLLQQVVRSIEWKKNAECEWSRVKEPLDKFNIS